MPSLYTRALDGITGELLFDQTSSTWVPGHADAEAILRILRTDLGSFLPDPTVGLNLAVLAKRGPNAKANIEAEVARATARAVKQRGLQEFKVVAEIQDRAAVISISFKSRNGATSSFSVTR
jgi:hypothetical protein